MINHKRAGLFVAGAAALVSMDTQAQSSSLYSVSADELDSVAASRYDIPQDRRRQHLPDINPEVAALTPYVVHQPVPRDFQVGDHVSIIISEAFASEMDAEKTTEKTSDLNGGINEFPRLTLKDLINLQTGGTTAANARVDIGFERTYEGEGEYERTESMTGRVKARIISIKPNGVLVLEARRTLINDGEQSLLVATGNCMPEDISASNTIISSDLENLFIDKQHSGDLRDASEKGWLTRLFDAIFDF